MFINHTAKPVKTLLAKQRLPIIMNGAEKHQTKTMTTIMTLTKTCLFMTRMASKMTVITTRKRRVRLREPTDVTDYPFVT